MAIQLSNEVIDDGHQARGLNPMPVSAISWLNWKTKE
jgi:hypothetical protein